MAGTRSTQINIIIAGDASQVSAAFAKVSADAQKLQTTLDETGAAAEADGAKIAEGAEAGVAPLALLGEAGEKTEAAFASATRTFALFGFAMEGIHQAVDIIKEISDSTVESQKITAQQGAVLASTGAAAGMTAQSLDELAESLKKTSTYDDDAIKGAENLLLTFTNIGQQTFPQATQAVIDMSTAMGQDLSQTAIMVGKALQDPINGATTLRRVGVQLDDQQVQLIKTMMQTGDVAGAQQVILQELSKEFGGSASAAVDTFGGQIQQLHNNLDDLTKISDQGALPAMTNLAAGLNSLATSGAVIEFFKELSAELQVIGEGNFWADWADTAYKALYVVASGWNDLIKQLSFGKIDFGPQLATFRAQIAAFDEDIHPQLVQTGQNIAGALSGQDGGPLAPSAVAADAQQVFSAYIAGFSQADLSQLSTLQGVIKSALSLSGNEDPGAALNLDPVVARAIDDLKRFGAVSDQTKAQLKAMLGDAYPEVEQYLDGLAKLNDAQRQAAESAMALGVATAQYAAFQKLAAGATQEAQDALDAATQAQQDHQQAAQAAEDAVQGQIDAVSRQAEDSQRAYQATLDTLQGQLDALQGRAQADQAAARARLDAAQAQADAIRTAAEQHAGMYQAILAGDVDYYEQEIGKEDELTQKIREKWDAEYSGLLRQKNGSDERLFEAQAAQHRTDLDYDTKIQAARQAGNIAQANALQRQKDLKDKQAQSDMTVLQDQATVAADNAKRAQDQIQKEAAQQADKDKVAQTRADAAVKQVQDQATAQKAADDAAIQAKQDEIKGVQDAEKADQARYDARKRQLQDELTTVQNNAKARDLLDQVAIQRAQDHKKIVDDEWANTLASAKTAADDAKSEKAAADAHAQTQDKINQTIKDRLALYAQEFTAIQKNNAEAAKDPRLPQNQTPPPPGIQENQPAGGGGNQPPTGGGTPKSAAPQVTAASAGPAVVAHFHFPGVTGQASPETARQAGLAAAQAFNGAFSDARKSGAGRVTV